ncbi:probable glutathione S-transferase [Cucurbita maxima]|uniref:Glutathione S-transferase n=1 Tax=Cucurbita maxima TaxID=3661 RepID=Q8H9E6_CUCMA|nr:probable glutathione S-transferase [Cucurbita maxima]BAC21262.1 glutathione S-transferse [Cucurbita maxima]
MSSSQELVLLDLRASPFATRVRVALAEKGLNCETKQEDLSNKTPLLLEMNPVHKQIPVLIHRGKPILESIIIVEYIDETWSSEAGYANLLPSHPYERSHARFWADYVDKKIYPNGGKLWNKKGLTEEEKEAAMKELLGSFKQLEEELGDKPYFGGQSFGFIDLSLIPFYSMFLAFKLLGNLDLEAECPKILEWAKRCCLRETVAKNMPTQQEVYDVVLDIIKRH